MLSIRYYFAMANKMLKMYFKNNIMSVLLKTSILLVKKIILNSSRRCVFFLITFENKLSHGEN